MSRLPHIICWCAWRVQTPVAHQGLFAIQKGCIPVCREKLDPPVCRLEERGRLTWWWLPGPVGGHIERGHCHPERQLHSDTQGVLLLVGPSPNTKRWWSRVADPAPAPKKNQQTNVGRWCRLWLHGGCEQSKKIVSRAVYGVYAPRSWLSPNIGLPCLAGLWRDALVGFSGNGPRPSVRPMGKAPG